MTTGTAGLPVAIVGTMIAATPGVVPWLIAIEALTRLLGLNNGVRPTLNRQTALTILQLALLLLLLLLASLLILLLLTLLLLTLVITLLSALAILLLTLLIGALLLVLLNLALLLQLLLLALLLRLLLLLLALLLLLTLLVFLLLALHLEATLLLLVLLVTLLLLLIVVVVGQHLSTDAQGQETDTCQTPDARVHAFLTAARIPVDRTAGRVRRSPHSISVADETVQARAALSAEVPAQKKRARWPSLEYFVLARRLWRRLTSHRLLDSAQPGGLINPVGLEAAAGLIRRAALDAVSGQ